MRGTMVDVNNGIDGLNDIQYNGNTGVQVKARKKRKKNRRLTVNSDLSSRLCIESRRLMNAKYRVDLESEKVSELEDTKNLVEKQHKIMN